MPALETQSGSATDLVKSPPRLTIFLVTSVLERILRFSGTTAFGTSVTNGSKFLTTTRNIGKSSSAEMYDAGRTCCYGGQIGERSGDHQTRSPVSVKLHTRVRRCHLCVDIVHERSQKITRKTLTISVSFPLASSRTRTHNTYMSVDL